MPATLADIQAKYGDSVYPLYKDQMHEPYMENKNGVGYQGVVMYDELEDKVQCAECGKWYKQLGSHNYKTHGTRAKEYKEKYGLFYNTQLCSKSLSTSRSIRLTNLKKQGKINVGKYGRISSFRKDGGKRQNIIQNKNRKGLCDAQIIARLAIISSESGKDLDKVNGGDVDKYDHNLLSVLCRQNGNWVNAAKRYNLTSFRNKFDDAETISWLRGYVRKNKKIPLCREIPSKIVADCFRLIGSWRRAKMMAGLDQLLAEVK